MKTPSLLRTSILVVEEDPRLNFFLSNSLSNAGYRVISTDGCLGALAMLDSGELPRIDILLTESRIAVLRGPEFVRWFRKLHPFAQCIVMSREMPEPIPKHWTWLPKPVEQETLIQTVDRLREPTRAAA